MFRVDKPIGVPERLTSMTVRPAWKDIATDRFQLEDERQQVVIRSEKGSATMKTTEVAWSDGSTFFLMNLIADEKSHDEHLATLFKILATFETLPKK